MPDKLTKEPEVLDEAVTQAMRGELTEEQQKLIEKLDKEASARTLENPLAARLFFWGCVLVTLYHFITSFYGTPVVLKHRSLHVAMMLVLGFIMYPSAGKKKNPAGTVLDTGLILLAAAVPLYMWLNYLGVVERAGRPNVTDTAAATILVILVLEASRRITGWALPILSTAFIVYGLAGPRGLWNVSLPMFGHRGYTWAQLSNHFFANTEGIYGTSVDVAASYIYLFILFGAVMGKCGMGAFFNDVAVALAGHTKGGPAKVSVISSGLLGSINGSAVANVVTTGAFTIPLMKKTGYSKEFSGAVEAAASVGGQLLPPVMGAAAFIMAEILSVPYSKIIIHAAIPALLYYLGIIIQVQLRAGKLGLLGLPRDQLPKVGAIMRDKGYLLIPIIVLVYLLLFTSWTVLLSAVVTIVVTLVITGAIGFFRKFPLVTFQDLRGAFMDVADACAEGARATVPVAVACACVGIIVGAISKTGFGINMADAIISFGSESLFFTLVFTMITCMILGMGVPSIPAYIITATIGARALAKLGIPDIAAHMFAFYFAMFANLTPPVALAAFAAAGLSGGDPVKTGVASVKLAIAGFIVPYMFIYSPQLLLLDTSLFQGLRVAVGACVGVFMIGAAVEGYLFAPMPWIMRLVAAAGALCLIDSGLYTDAIGGVVLCELLLIQHCLAARRNISLIGRAGVSGLFLGVPLSYLFQDWERVRSFGEYLSAVKNSVAALINPAGGFVPMTDALTILTLVCLLCALALSVTGYWIDHFRSGK
ncbi:MAG: TRAP transporter permease [Synergistaceae bacterium]|jgi:TRAP transporter 4TM/12TM fusion protein|nr:TRAP transporter permease [Synergistaceae bacterium]